MAMAGSARRAGRPLPRLGRLVLSRNELRRPSDRIEAAIIMSLAAAFLTAVVAAACFAGHLYQSQRIYQSQRGTQTTAPGPAVYRVPAGAAVRGWPGHSGQPRLLRPGPRDRSADALLAGTTITVGAAVALILCYRLCRAVLDRHRLAGWDSAWAVVGPQWTSRP
jgi:hypothetical protein